VYLQSLSDSDPTVRECASYATAACIHVVGERPVTACWGDVMNDAQKKAKVVGGELNMFILCVVAD
jgi:hypothetical protein